MSETAWDFFTKEKQMLKYQMPIIDTHTHIYPEKIAEKATSAVGVFYDYPMKSIGTVETLKRHMNAAGVGMSFILSVATVPKQVRGINDFLISTVKENPGIFVPFGTVHLDMENIVDELEYIRNNKIFGLKFHPDFQKFAVDDPRMDVVYEYAQEYRLPIVFHAGDKRYHYSNPVLLKKVIDRFPNLIAVAAHFGGYSEWEDVCEYLCGTNYYFDTSSTLGMMTDYSLPKKIISEHDENKILFASDFPMWTPEFELSNIEKLGLSSGLLEKILHKNAEELIARAK